MILFPHWKRLREKGSAFEVLCLKKNLIFKDEEPNLVLNPIYKAYKIGNLENSMKKDIHPQFRKVVFKDISTEDVFLTYSTANTKDTIQWEDGNEYPLYKVEISSASHPFYTGTQKVLDTEGRIDRFKKRYARFDKKKS